MNLFLFLLDLNSMYITLGKTNGTLRHLIDWVYLNKIIKNKCDLIRMNK